jgi:hypothetical protein
MTAPIYFSLRQAEEAEDRAENGAKALPGDDLLIADLDGFRSQRWDSYWAPIHEAEDRERESAWLATQCPGCEVGGIGEPCDLHFGPEDACIACDDGTGVVLCETCREVPA